MRRQTKAARKAKMLEAQCKSSRLLYNMYRSLSLFFLFGYIFGWLSRSLADDSEQLAINSGMLFFMLLVSCIVSLTVIAIVIMRLRSERNRGRGGRRK